MKNLKRLFSGLLFLMVICHFGHAQAGNHTELPVYQNTIANISLGYKDAMLGGTIKLNNGLLLRIVDYNNRDDNVMVKWQAGDIVTLKAQIKDEVLIISAKRLNEQNPEVELYLIFDVTQGTKSALRIVEINEEGRFVKLNDNSVWEFSWYNHLSTKKWQTGQHVVVQGQGDKNSYDFINLDAPIALNVASATASFVSH